MNLLGTEYNIKMRALEVYLAGCRPPHCNGCHNPQSHNFGAGVLLTQDSVNAIVKKVNSSGRLVNKIVIMGGDPMHQDPDSLRWFLAHLGGTGRDLWMFTREPLNDIPRSVLKYLTIVKTGRFDREFLPREDERTGVWLASSNQEIHKVGMKHGD